MSGKEAPRPGILQALCDERITNGEAATALQLTVRQVQRLKGRYRTAGAAGLVHGGRGQPSPRQLADPVRAQITTLMATVYAGFNDVHLTEKLQEAQGLRVSRSTVRRLRQAAKLPPTRRRRGRAYRRRPHRRVLPPVQRRELRDGQRILGARWGRGPRSDLDGRRQLGVA